MTKKSRNIALLFGLVTIIEGILWYFMPIYFESRLNSLLLVSVAIAAHPIASLMAGLPAGDICDKIGRKFAFILGLFGFVMSFIFLFIGNFYSLTMFMIFYGIFSTLYGVSAFVSVLDGSKVKFAGQSAGFFTAIQYAGWMFGSLIGGLLILLMEPFFMMQVLTMTLALIMSASLFVFPGKSGFGVKKLLRSERILIQDKIFLGEIRSITRFGKPLIAILIFSFAMGYWEYAIWTFEPIYTNSIGSGIIIGAFILSLISLPGLLSSLVAGKLLDKNGIRKFLPLSAASIIAGQLIFLSSQSLLTLAISLVLTSFGAIFIAISIDYYIKKRVRKNLRGEVDGAYEMMYNIGGVIGPLTIGIALAVENLHHLYYFTFPLFIVALGALAFAKGIN